MANSRKKISELPALSVASLDTTFVLGISGSTTYKISINNLTSSLDTTFATDLVTSALSSSLSGKLSTSSFNSYTQSFTASVASGTISGSSQLTSSFDTRYTLSGSIPNIPTGSFATTGSNTFNGDMTLISSSNIILKGPALEYGGDGISGSGDIIWQDLYGNEMARLWKAADRDILTVSFTGSHNSYIYGTLIHSLNLKEFGDDHFILTSSFNSYTASISTGSLVNRLNAIESVSGSWITESETGSFLTSLSGAISSSSQLTSSYDTRYTLSGSVQPLPSNLLSSSAQITAFGFVSGSYETTGRGIISSSANLVTTSSYNADSASFDTRINSITVSSGSNLTYLLEAYANVTYTLPGGFTHDPCRYSVVSATENVPSNWFNTSTYRFTPQKAGYWEINAAYDVYRNTEASMAIRKNGSIVASAGSFNAVAQDISKIIYLNGSTDYIDIVNTGGAALQRDQYQQRSWFQAKFVGNIDGSTDLLTTNNTFTGTNTFTETTTLRGAVNVGTGSGLEGGEIDLALAQSGNTTLTGSAVVFDVYGDKVRIFEGGGNSRGVSIDLSKAPNGVGGELMWKKSGYVDAGTFLTLDNVKVTITTSGNRGASIGAVSTTFVANISGQYGYTAGGSGMSAYNVSYTTTASASAFGWSFGTEGDAATYILNDKTNSRVYRITTMIGLGFLNNFISIERLY